MIAVRIDRTCAWQSWCAGILQTEVTSEGAARFDSAQLRQLAPTHIRRAYAWEFEKAGREIKVRVEGQLTFKLSR